MALPTEAPSPTIRLATPADADELARLRWEMSAEFRDPTEDEDAFRERMADDVRSYLSGPDWSIWAAEDPDQPHRLIANACLQRVRKVARPYARPTHWGYVTNVYVDQAWRNRGLGQAILERLIAQARSEGLDTLLLWPSQRAVSLYERVGFAPATGAMELPLSAS
jgi:GNAT superfamily N-acetyltransferase